MPSFDGTNPVTALGLLEQQGWKPTGERIVLTTGATGDGILSPAGELNVLTDTGALLSAPSSLIASREPWSHFGITNAGGLAPATSNPADPSTPSAAGASGTVFFAGLAVLAFWFLFARKH